MSASLVHENVWTDRSVYEQAEQKYYENLNKVTLTPLADEVAKARLKLNEIRDNLEPATEMISPVDAGAVKFLMKKVLEFDTLVSVINTKLVSLNTRVQSLENRLNEKPPLTTDQPTLSTEAPVNKSVEADDDDVDLFGSDSDNDGDADKLREERLAAYNAKKSKKPALIAKSSIILDIKPWDDETDMKEMEVLVRKIEMDGLLWGASKLVPLAFGIHKLQITCVIEDEKVSVDLLQEKIQENEHYVQSVDVAAFNKI